MKDHKKNGPKRFRQGLYLVFTALLILTTFTLIILSSSSSSTSSFPSPLIISSASAQEGNETMDQGPSPTPNKKDGEDETLFATTAGPEADAGPDQEVNEGVTVSLNGDDSSGPDDGSLSFKWTQVEPSPPTIVLNGADTSQASFTAPQVEADTSFVFDLTVTDENGGSDSDSVEVLVRNDATATNQLPIANAGSDATAKPGETVTLDGSASNDPGGDESKLKYDWRQIGGAASTYSVTLSSDDAVNPTFTVPSSINAKTILSFQLTVTDENGGSDSDSVEITIDAGGSPPTNQPPIANAGTDITARGGETGTFDGTRSTDPEGSPLNYQWIKVAGPSTIVLSGNLSSEATFTAPSDSKDTLYVFELKVTDSGGLSSTDYVFVNVKKMGQQQGTSRTLTDQCIGEQQQPGNITNATTQTQTQTPLPSFRQYENVTYGIRMMYPDNWTISQSDAKPVAVFSAPAPSEAIITASSEVPSSQQEKSPIRAPATVILNVNSLPVQNMTLDQYTTEYLIRLINSPTHYDLVLDNVFGFNMTGPTYQTIGGQQEAGGGAAAVNTILPFHLVEYSGISFVDGCNIRGVDLWTVIDNKVYSITYLAVDPVYYTTYLPLAEQMAGSFQVIDGGNGNNMDTSGATTSQELAIPTATSNDNRDPPE
jgi:hypothetical protein